MPISRFLAVLSLSLAAAVANAQVIVEIPVEEAGPDTAADPPAVADELKPSVEAEVETAPIDQMADDEPTGGLLSEYEDDPDNPGMTTLDRATDLKLNASDLKDLNEVVDLLDEAIEEGLDAANTDFAEQMLSATLMQRAEALSGIVLRQPMPNPQVDPRGLQWLQVRGRAITDLLRVVALDEKQFDAWILIGRLQSLPRGDQSEARRALTSAIKLAEASADDPNADLIEPSVLAQAYALRGAAQKDDADRLADFGRAIELEPEKAEFLLLRAQAHRAAQRPDECLADIDRAIEIAPDNPKVWELKALALSMQGRNEEAIEAFDKASELAPQLLSAYQYRSELYSQLGKLDEAIAQLDKALEVSPNNLASLLIRANLFSVAERHEEALADIEAILKQRPMLPRVLLMKAQALDKLDRTNEAVALLEQLAGANPNNAQLQMQLAAFYTDKQMAAEAITALDRALEIEPGNGLAWRLRGDMNLYAGDHEAAIADFDKALEIEPNDSGVLNNYAWTLATSPFPEVRDGERAIELATKAAELTQQNAPHILSTLGAAYAEAGQFDEAVASAEKAVAKAEELGVTGSYDGQLEAELNCYRSGQPWRELQKLSVSGPADKTADQLKDLDALEDLESLPIEQPEDPIIESPDAQPAMPLEEAPPRSFDF